MKGREGMRRQPVHLSEEIDRLLLDGDESTFHSVERNKKGEGNKYNANLTKLSQCELLSLCV